MIKRKYKVRVPYIAIYSQREVDTYGTPLDITDGIADMDTDINVMTNSYLDIDRLIDIYSNGWQIVLVNRDDLVTITGEIEDYIELLTKRQHVGVNRQPLEDDRLEDIITFYEEICDGNMEHLINANNIDYTFDNSWGNGLMDTNVSTTISGSYTLDSGVTKHQPKVNTSIINVIGR